MSTSYLLGINMLQIGKHRPKLSLRVDFSNGTHHSVRVPAGVSARELSKVLRELATILDEDPRLSK